MRQIFTTILTICSLAAFGQYPINNIKITLPPNPTPNTGDWINNTRPLSITANALLEGDRVSNLLLNCRILVTIKKGSIVCGNFTPQTAPEIVFTEATRTWSGTKALDLLGHNCTLSPGNYEFCVQFYSTTKPTVPLSVEVYKPFTIALNNASPMTKERETTRVTPSAVNNQIYASKGFFGNDLVCPCDACNETNYEIVIPPQSQILVNSDNTITYSQSISIGGTMPKLVKTIKAGLIYFEFKSENDYCLPCNKDSKTFGNFGSGTISNITAAGAGTHSLSWNFSPPKNFGSGNLASMSILLPPMVKCCEGTVRWCIRYVVTFDNCTTCYKRVCYTAKKAGCGDTKVISNSSIKSK